MIPFDSRATWHAQPPRGPLSAWPTGMPAGIAWHYVGGAGPFRMASHADCLAWVLALQRRETGRGLVAKLRNAVRRLVARTVWSYIDVSYNLICCPHGRVIDGRGIDVQSGAQLGGNDRWIGVLFMLNVGDQMTPALKQAAIYARAYVLERYPRATGQVAHHAVAGNPTGTACGGPVVDAFLAAGGAIPDPQPTPEEDMRGLWAPDRPLMKGKYVGRTPTVLVDDRDFPISGRILDAGDEATWYEAKLGQPVRMPHSFVENLNLVERSVD